MIMVRTRTGDTLIEVTIAIGIFSMIAIGVASVMSSGTSGSQTALETTLARAEIAAQAEALRFIHSSYVSSKSKENTDGGNLNNPYKTIWETITANAVEANQDITQFAPETCDELYNDDEVDNKNNLFAQNAFVLNVKNLSDANTYVLAKENHDKFAITTTYPRLVFNSSDNANSSDSSLYDTADSTELFRAEGVYVVAVKDSDTTQIVTDKTTTGKSAFYDFYIRTCWYGADATRPSTIATLIRLYDPSVTSSKQSNP